MTEKKQINPGWYTTGAVFAVVLVIIISCCIRWKAPGNVNTSDRNLRIVSLAPNITEMLFALGLADCIVGVTDGCDYPAQAKNVECVGGFGKPNIENLLALRPDLVIATDFENNDAAKLLSTSGIRVMELQIRSFREMFEALREIGRVTAREPRAEKIVEQMQAELKAIADKFEPIQPSQRPKVFIEIWYDPITTAGKASFIDEVITRAGGVNVAGNINKSYLNINPEKVIDWNPDVIILCYMGPDGCSASQLAGRIGWADISAVRQGRIIEDIPSDLILRPGPRLIEGISVLARRLYGTESEKYVVGGTDE